MPQAKGLEFDDVYLINFFQDSEADTEWRVLCSFLQKIREERVRRIPEQKDVKDTGQFDTALAMGA